MNARTAFEDTSSGALPRLLADCAGASDRGRVREANEDQYLIARLSRLARVEDTSLGEALPTHQLLGPPQSLLLVVADGMGGLSRGARASAIAVLDVLRHVIRRPAVFDGDPSTEAVQDQLRKAVERGRRDLARELRLLPGKRLGTTLTVAYVAWPQLYVVHVGDSRCHLLREGELRQVTRDHTVAQQLVEEGVLEQEEAPLSSYNHVLWNALTSDEDPQSCQPELHAVTLHPGDQLLLCTDGLSRHVPEEQVVRVLNQADSAAAACEALVERANQAGGEDNVTVVVARFRRIGSAGDDAAHGGKHS